MIHKENIMRSTPISVFDIVEDIFNSADPFRLLDSFQTPRQIRELSASSFPPTDICISADKEYLIKIALAGIEESQIKLDFEGRTLQLAVDNEPVEGEHVIQNGIKSFTHLETSYAIPKQWDIEKLEARFKQGLLTIKIPPKEEVAKLPAKKAVKLITE
jgi:HSP20 family protein